MNRKNKSRRRNARSVLPLHFDVVCPNANSQVPPIVEISFTKASDRRSPGESRRKATRDDEKSNRESEREIWHSDAERRRSWAIPVATAKSLILIRHRCGETAKRDNGRRRQSRKTGNASVCLGLSYTRCARSYRHLPAACRLKCTY